MSGCQNYGPLLGPLNTRCRTIIGTQKGTMILTTTQYTMKLLGACGAGALYLDHQHPGHDRPVGEVSRELRLVGGDVPGLPEAKVAQKRIPKISHKGPKYLTIGHVGFLY